MSLGNRAGLQAPDRRLGLWLGALLRAPAGLYRPSKLRERGLLWTGAVAVATLVVMFYLIGVDRGREPAPFDVREIALAMAGGKETCVVPGSLHGDAQSSGADDTKQARRLPAQ